MKVHGLKLYANKPDRILALLLWKYKILENNEISIVKDKLASGMTVIDIGANVGLYTSILSVLVGSKGRVYSFEPDPNNYRLLKKCIENNNLNNVVLEKKAVCSQTSKSYFYQSQINSGDNRLYKTNKHYEKIQVNKVSLDDYFKPNTNIDFIKMDIQGSEYNALRGMKKLISKNTNIIILSELCPDMISMNGSTAFEYLNYIISNYFKIYYINKKKNKLVNIDNKNIVNISNIKGYINIFITKNIINNS